jgi:excisionase family DNA binding protein
MPDNIYFSVTQFAKQHDLSVGRVRQMILSGRLSAIKIGNQWAIPANTPRPEDRRVKTGKYKDWRKKPES